jgi:hypothetical protein
MLQEEELRILFNEGIAGQLGKKKSQAKADALKLGLTEQSKDVADLLDGLSSDSEDDDVDDYRKMDRGETVRDSYQEETIEVFREKTIEDLIDDQRTKLAAEGKVETYIYICIYVYRFVCVCTDMYIYSYLHSNIYIDTYTYMYIYACIYIYI